MSPEDTAILKHGAEALERSLGIFEAWLEDGHNDSSLYQATLSLATALQHVYRSCPDLLNEASRARVAEIIQKAQAMPKGRSNFNTGF
jgi:hypothetical protein